MLAVIMFCYERARESSVYKKSLKQSSKSTLPNFVQIRNCKFQNWLLLTWLTTSNENLSKLQRKVLENPAKSLLTNDVDSVLKRVD